MDPDRHLPIPGHKHPPTMMPPDPQARPIVPSATTYQPSLPSIRQLHPYLPPSGSTQPHLPAQDSPSYGYAPPGGYAGPSGSTDFHPSPPIPRGSVHRRSEGLDSEQEGEAEQAGPAKKKRRRQALSCNECKRRKIKCDRAQPCGPCTRRGEQSKCQWRTLEPVDKYVTRTEYDELKSRCRADYDQLKARLDRLEAIVSAPAAAPISLPMYSVSSDMPGAPPPESMSYPAGHASSSGPVLYSPGVPPSSYPTDPTPKPPQYPSTSPRLITPVALSSASPQPHPPGGSGGPGHTRRTSTSETKSPTTVRQSPLSLASITSPFNTEQPKNCHAQTPHMPGGRLRPVPPHLPPRQDDWTGPATLCCDTQPPTRTHTHTHTHTRQRQRAVRTSPWKARLVLPWGFIYPDHRRADDMVIRA